MFLVPVKKSRATTGSIDVIIQSDEESNSSHQDETQAQDTDFIAVAEEIVVGEKTTKELGAQLYGAPTPMKRLKLNQKRIQTDNDDEELMKLLRQRQEQKNTESTRLHFFRSILPKVDSLTDDEFLDFQVDVLQLLRKNITRHCHISGSRTVSLIVLNVQIQFFTFIDRILLNLSSRPTTHLVHSSGYSYSYTAVLPPRPGSSYCWLSKCIQLTSRSILTFLRL